MQQSAVPVEVGWLFSLIRSGSSAAAYSAAAPWGLPVADEVFGPWVRTGKVYRFPREQRQLVEEFKAAGHRLTPGVIDLANRVLGLLGAETGRVVCKCPHLLFTPEEFADAFPGHRAAYLIRNPLHRLNSHYLRGWEWMIEPDHDARIYTEFARRWLSAEHRVQFDDLRRRPQEFFAALYRAWGWEHSPRDLAAAAGYRAGHYHGSSKQTDAGKPTDRVDSERARALPAAAVGAYLDDPFLRGFMRDRGWSVRARSYQPGLVARVLRRSPAASPPGASA